METEKINHQPSSTDPLPPQQGYVRRDEESLSAQELYKKKRKKRLACVTSFLVLLAIAIIVYLIVATRYKTPRFRLKAASFSTFEVGNSTNPSFNLVMNARFSIKNRNFGRYKYDSGVVVFEYRGMAVGQAYIDDARVRARTTKKVNAMVVLNSGGLIGGDAVFDELGSDIGAGVLELRSRSELEGKIEVVRVIKKEKYARLNCTMDVQIATQSVQNLICE
ncbi:hypothetical protein TIFTF001_013700 [Ficus carica]|uniref:Late embryogenesis abundant protein LEA-2 subgroup domain-containing protein n=1 Tax=Ficus carica TaxID=3494 RepID=A0AA88AES2_FICCA|nr:hypothetical protein TIFTF001_013700 [Ficus carica]